MRGIPVAIVGCGLLLAGCAGGESGPPAPTGTAVEQPSTGETTPFPGQNPVHLLYISDSAGFATGEAYAALAEERLGVPVELVDWRTGGLSLAEVPDRIARESEVVAHAEIVVLWAGPRHSGVRMDILWCVDGDNLMDHDVYTVADWAPFADLEGQVLDAIWDARGGEPTVLLATDLYVPFPAKWEEHGIFDACMTSFETMSESLRVAAEAHGATFVSSLDTYNGPDHRRDPTAAGWIDEDGIHPGEAGAQAMAEALAAVGFQPAAAP